MAWRRPPILLGVLCLACSCEIPRPDGAYDPQPRDAATPPDPIEAVGEDDVPDLGGGGMPVELAPHDAGPIEALADASAPAVEDSPLVALQKALSGDYWMRVDFYGTADASGVQIDTHTVAYSLVKVGLDPVQQFKFIDWQCAVEIVQTCVSGCASATTTIAVGGGRAYRPAIRTLTVDVDTLAFGTTAEWFATGWRGNSAEDPMAVLPAREADERVYDPDGGGPGVNVHVAVDASGLLPDVNCTMRIAQRYEQVYSGLLVDGSLDRGSVADDGSEQVVLSYGDCPSGGSGRRAAPATMHLRRAGVPIDEQWTCPAVADFAQRLPDP